MMRMISDRMIAAALLDQWHLSFALSQTVWGGQWSPYQSRRQELTAYACRVLGLFPRQVESGGGDAPAPERRQS